MQIGGGLLSLSKKTKTAKLGLHVVTGGLIFQQLLIAIFMATTFRFTQKLARSHSTLSTPHQRGPGGMIYILRASLCLITYRIVFRLVEFCSTQGSPVNPYINHHEFFVYACDAGPMLVALLLMNVWHPGKILRGKMVYVNLGYQGYEMGQN